MTTRLCAHCGHLLEPLLCIPSLKPMGGRYVAMADPELLSKPSVSRDLIIQHSNPLLDIRDQSRIDSTLFDHPIPPRGTKPWLQTHEGETPTQREIDEGQRPVGDIHRADDVEVFRNVDGATFAIRVRVAQFQCLIGRALSSFKQRQEFSEDLRRVATVDLLDHHDELRRWVLRRCLDRFHEYAVG
jgi:hypothetical protein